MGNKFSQWRFLDGDNRYGCYPYRQPSSSDPPDVRRVLSRHHFTSYLSGAFMKIEICQRKQFFIGLHSRLLLLAAGIENNPGPSDSISSSSKHQPKRLKTIDTFFQRQLTSISSVAALVDLPICTETASPPLINTSLSGACVDDSSNAVSASAGYASDTLSSNLSSCSSSQVMANDVGNFIGKNISDYQKRELLLNHWQPPQDYKFPFSYYTRTEKVYRRYVNHMWDREEGCDRERESERASREAVSRW